MDIGLGVGFQTPALVALLLLLLETLFMGLYLPETKASIVSNETETKEPKSSSTLEQDTKEKKEKETKKSFALLHCLFLFVFSGIEFTLSFLTFDKFGFTNIQNGY